MNNTEIERDIFARESNYAVCILIFHEALKQLFIHSLAVVIP